MDNHIPITDEELTDLYKRFVVGPTTILDSVEYSTLARLITSLRASRSEFEEYIKWVQENECGCL